LAAEDASLQRQIQVLDANASRQAREVGEAQDRIRTRIRSYLRLPPNLAGNPESVFRVTLLPNGEVLQTQLLRSSGQASYDREVERAILKASPLPLPKDRGAAAVFRDGLILKFRPREEAAAGR
jgi:colicin import membrane protein